MMAKYDTDGNGTFSAMEVREIVRDMSRAKKEARNMGRLAAAVAIAGILLAAALLGLMFAANEASKEQHVKGGVSVDLDNKPVETKPLQSFGSLLTFPAMAASVLNELDYVSFSAIDGAGEMEDMRFRVSAWTRKQSDKTTTLLTQDGSTITIQGDGSSASLTMSSVTYAIEVPAHQRRILPDHRERSSQQPQLFRSMEELQEHLMVEGVDRRELGFFSALMTSGKAKSACIELADFVCIVWLHQVPLR